MSFYYIKTEINNLCRPIKILEDEELSMAHFIERGKRYILLNEFFVN